MGKNMDEQPRWRKITFSTKAWEPAHIGVCLSSAITHPAPCMATAWTRAVGTHFCSFLVNHHVKYHCLQMNRHNLKECKPSYNVFIIFLQSRFPISHPVLSFITCSCSWYQNINSFAWGFYQFMYQNFFLAKTSLLHLVSTERQRVMWLKQTESRLDKLLLDLIRLKVLFWVWKLLLHGISDFKSPH